MDASAYRAAVRTILDEAAADVTSTLRRLGDAADHAGCDLVIDVFTGQDGEGPFDVWARFAGDGAFALDRRFDDERQLFGVEWGEEGWSPAVPARPRGWSIDEFDTAVFEAVAAWLDPLIPAADVAWELASADSAIEPRPLGAGR
ncbi:DUF6389 family protein [Microbacterium sp. NPDC055903]